MTREEAIDILRSYLMFDKSNMQIDIALNMAIEALQTEVVRCKDCVYCEPYAIDPGEDFMTGYWCGENQKDTILQGFCFYGERKGGGDE